MLISSHAVKWFELLCYVFEPFPLSSFVSIQCQCCAITELRWGTDLTLTEPVH